MEKFSKEQYEKTKDFIFQHGRKLEQKLFEFHFESGSASQVLKVLADYQNEDGGFGHALESDLRTLLSSVIATCQGFNVYQEINVFNDKSIVGKAIDYLLENFDSENNVWPIIPAAASDSPHAYWWASKDLEERFDHYKINPTITVVAHLHNHSELVPVDKLEEFLDLAMKRLDYLSDQSDIYVLYSYMNLIAAEKLPGNIKATVQHQICECLLEIIETDPKKWSGHCMTPIQAVKNPQSPFVDAIPPDLLQKSLDHEINSQLDDGSWPVSWTWEEIYPQDWKKAEQEWKGYLALQRLKMFRSFGRIEGYDSKF